MPGTPLLDYQLGRAEAARSATRQPTAEPTPPKHRHAEARAMVREALTFPDALEAVWAHLRAKAEADLIPDFSSERERLRGYLDSLISAMRAILDWARREGESLGREIPRTEELATAIAEAQRFRDRALDDWPDPAHDFAGAAPTLGTLDVADRDAYLGPDEFSARLRGG
jgi:hypothetical protein